MAQRTTSARAKGRRLRLRRRARQAAGVAILAAVAGTSSAAADKTQSPAAIREAAEAFLRAELAGAFDQVSVNARGVDSRLNLQACDQGLEAFVPYGRTPQRASTVGVRCTGEQPWTIYVRMEVEAQTEMVVAARALSRGSRITRKDVRLAPRDAQRIRDAFYQKPERVVGQEVRRGLREGSAITGTDIQPPQLIDRGDQVVIRAGQGGSIEITSRGRALERGREGERVRVENLSSNNEIQGRVTGEGQVRVSY